jgi:DNA replication and repair protein RecF
MTSIRSLKVQGVRNITKAHLSGLTRVNHLYGANGAGKTSFLEALHLLGLGRSFRSNKQLPLIAHQQESAVVFGEMTTTSSADSLACNPSLMTSAVGIGVQRNRDGSSEIRINGQRAVSAAQLADLLPLQVIDADAFELLLGAPSIRRQFLDWGVFHVEHGFLDLWRRWQRTLKQRNSLLRRGNITVRELGPWDLEFCRLAESISDLRSAYFTQWLPVLFDLLGRIWAYPIKLEITFFPGWDRRLNAQEMLNRQLARDKDLGYTTMGPQRADLRIKINGMPVGEVLSRGQLKLLSVAMRISQGYMLDIYAAKPCIFLVDDLPAELDSERRSAVVDILLQCSGQVFFTSVDKNGLDFSGMSSNALSVFHVEHGVIHQ